MYLKLYGISQEYPISRKNEKLLCTGNLLGYIPGYPISRKTENFYVPEFFWDIPGISHIPQKQKFSMYRNFFGISHIPIFF